MRKKIFHNWGLKLISLVLAAFLWIVVVQMGDPQTDKDMGNIQVRLTNTGLFEKENKVYEILDNSDTVRVTVRAPRSVFERLRSSDIVAEADVSRLTDINTIPISFSTSIANVASINGNRDVIRLSVEDKESKYVNVIASTTGSVAEGYMVAGVTPDQNRIEISGPKSAVERVKYAGVEIDVTDAVSNLAVNVDINLYDAKGELVQQDNLVKNVDYIRMSAEVLAVKEVPVEVNFTGTPADGYLATGVVEYEPKTVLIAGNGYALSRINSIVIPDELIDITGAAEDVNTTVDIRELLASNIRLASDEFNGKVAVKIYVESKTERILYVPAQNIQIANVPDGLQAYMEVPESGVFLIEIEGLSEQVTAASADSVTGTVDVGAWMRAENRKELKAGVYEIPISFSVNGSVRINSSLRARVTVAQIENE